MRGIDEHKSRSSLTLESIIPQSLWYARCCILSASLMSGFGIRVEGTQSRDEDYIRILRDEGNKEQIPGGAVMLRAIYKKGDPHFASQPEVGSREDRSYVWDESSFKRIVSPSSQAFLMLDEVMLAKYLYRRSEEGEDDSRLNALPQILMDSAAAQGKFMSDYLRNSDGLFVSKLDSGRNPFMEPELEGDEDTPAVTEQAAAMKAYSALAVALDDDRYPLFRNPTSASSFKKYAEEILMMLRDSSDDVFGCKTKDLSGTISSLVQHHRSNPSNELLKYIASLAVELESRMDMSGNIARFPDSDTFTSNSSCFYVIKPLIESYRVTGIEKLLDASTLLYRKLDLCWDRSCGLYSLEPGDKYKYTLRDVGYVIAGLNTVRLFGDPSVRDEAAARLAAFFNSAVNSSGIVQSSMPPPDIGRHPARPERTDADQEESVKQEFITPGIPIFPKGNIAPVFAKKFTYRPKKRKYSINSSTFYSDYALFTASEMMCMGYPDVECFPL